ncbi:hypothetical protein LZ31DRAFT_191220 [Colletotrichum somersetense]|nr:hypothetical protein LZ31DRAFT_191220 [Colletotrichum somersetense]
MTVPACLGLSLLYASHPSRRGCVDTWIGTLRRPLLACFHCLCIPPCCRFELPGAIRTDNFVSLPALHYLRDNAPLAHILVSPHYQEPPEPCTYVFPGPRPHRYAPKLLLLPRSSHVLTLFIHTNNLWAKCSRYIMAYRGLVAYSRQEI